MHRIQTKAKCGYYKESKQMGHESQLTSRTQKDYKAPVIRRGGGRIVPLHSGENLSVEIEPLLNTTFNTENTQWNASSHL